IITDAQGNIKNESDFYPWGGELPFVANDSNHYKFTGKERDSETQLDYFGARYYSSGLGRFITPDWAARATAVPYAEFSDPQSLNLFTYVRDIPTTRYDADGHDILDYSCNCSPVNAKTDGHPIRDTLVVGAVTVTAGLAPAAGPILRGLVGLLGVTAPTTVPIAKAIIEAATPG